MVQTLSKNVGSDLTTSNVKDIYKVRGKKEGSQNTPIVVEIAPSLQKMDLLKKRKIFNNMNKSKLRAKNFGMTTSEQTPIFVSEQLTAKAAWFYFIARDLVKSTDYKYCWTNYGNVYVRKDDESAIITLTSKAKIH